MVFGIFNDVFLEDFSLLESCFQCFCDMFFLCELPDQFCIILAKIFVLFVVIPIITSISPVCPDIYVATRERVYLFLEQSNCTDK